MGKGGRYQFGPSIICVRAVRGSRILDSPRKELSHVRHDEGAVEEAICRKAG